MDLIAKRTSDSKQKENMDPNKKRKFKDTIFPAGQSVDASEVKAGGDQAVLRLRVAAAAASGQAWPFRHADPPRQTPGRTPPTTHESFIQGANQLSTCACKVEVTMHTVTILICRNFKLFSPREPQWKIS